MSTALFTIFLLIVLLRNFFIYCTGTNNDGLVSLKHEHKDDEKYRVMSYYISELPKLEKYVVSVRRRTYNFIFGDDHLCGGCIIASKIILTSALCLKEHDTIISHTELSVVVGSPNRLVYTKNTERLLVKNVILHPKYGEHKWNWNVGLLKLYRKIHLNSQTAAIIPLPTTDLHQGMELHLVGWGRYYKNGPKPGRMVYADIFVMDGELCKNVHTNLGGNEACATEMQTDAGDLCLGDKGGSAIYNETLVGIVQYSDSCVSVLQPIRFLKMFKLFKWIAENKRHRHYLSYWCYLVIVFNIFNK